MMLNQLENVPFGSAQGTFSAGKAISLNEYTQVNGFRLRSTLDPLFQNGIFISGDRLRSFLDIA